MTKNERKHENKKNNIGLILPNLVKAISELSVEKILGVIYFYKYDECSCCYGPKGVYFMIEGNYSNNMGWYDKEINDWRVRYNDNNKEKADRLAKILRNHLRGTGYRLEWDGNVSKCMLIKSIKKS